MMIKFHDEIIEASSDCLAVKKREDSTEEKVGLGV
jgi:hypothetical protein